MTWSQFFIFLLFADAAWVAYGLLKKRNMWRWICCYWVLLTMKNLFDILKI